MNASVEAKSPQEYRRENRPVSRPLAWLFLSASVAFGSDRVAGSEPLRNRVRAFSVVAGGWDRPPPWTKSLRSSLRIRTHGLTPVDLGTVVYDSNQRGLLACGRPTSPDIPTCAPRGAVPLFQREPRRVDASHQSGRNHGLPDRSQLGQCAEPVTTAAGDRLRTTKTGSFRRILPRTQPVPLTTMATSACCARAARLTTSTASV